jgi:hypothetical protein
VQARIRRDGLRERENSHVLSPSRKPLASGMVAMRGGGGGEEEH